jgi:hypothetical protein
MNKEKGWFQRGSAHEKYVEHWASLFGPIIHHFD